MRLGLETIKDLLKYKLKLHRTELIIIGMIYGRFKLKLAEEFFWYNPIKPLHLQGG